MPKITEEIQYRLEGLVPPNRNIHHPEGGWLVSARGTKEYCDKMSLHCTGEFPFRVVEDKEEE